MNEEEPVRLPLSDEQIWGLGEVRPVKPPPEVVKQILAAPEIEADYPHIFAQAKKLQETNS